MRGRYPRLLRHVPRAPGYPNLMGDRQHTQQPVESHRTHEVDGASDEEDLSAADVVDRVDLDPDEQLNRPDQPGASAEERRPYEDPVGPPIAPTTGDTEDR